MYMYLCAEKKKAKGNRKSLSNNSRCWCISNQETRRKWKPRYVNRQQTRGGKKLGELKKKVYKGS